MTHRARAVVLSSTIALLGGATAAIQREVWMPLCAMVVMHGVFQWLMLRLR